MGSIHINIRFLRSERPIMRMSNIYLFFRYFLFDWTDSVQPRLSQSSFVMKNLVSLWNICILMNIMENICKYGWHPSALYPGLAHPDLTDRHRLWPKLWPLHKYTCKCDGQDCRFSQHPWMVIELYLNRFKKTAWIAI